MNSAAVNTGARASFQIMVFSRYRPVVRLPDHISACMQSLGKMVQRNLPAGQEERLGHKELVDIEKEVVDITWEEEYGVTRERTTDIYARHRRCHICKTMCNTDS